MLRVRKVVAGVLALLSLAAGIIIFAKAPAPTLAQEVTYYCDDLVEEMQTQYGSSEELTATEIGPDEQANGIVPTGGGSYSYEDVTIEYDFKHITSKSIRAPIYYNSTTLKTVCAPVAGTMIVTYYDRWYSNLIPNVSPGYTVNDLFYYYSWEVNAAAYKATLWDLYDAMGTDVGSSGTTLNGFLTGLNSYVRNKGYNLSYTSIKQNDTVVNITSLDGWLNQNKVSAIFCTKYNFINAIIDTGTKTYYSKFKNDGGHVMMVYGYEAHYYFKNNAVFQMETFLKVASGFDTGETGYVKLSDYLSLSEAYAFNIY